MRLAVPAFLSLAAIALTIPVDASPVAALRRDATPVTTSSTEIASYVTPAQFAAQAYCVNLKAGSKLGPDGTVLFAAGNGRDVQRVYVAHSPSQGVVVAYQGTNTSSIDSIENDIEAVRADVDSRLAFLGSDATVDSGFQDAWLDTADAVLAQVKSALSKHSGARLLVVGHSLGASIALLSAAHLSHNTGTAARAVLFGLPRTGNDAFADGIDRYLPNQHHIVNHNDPVPHLPGMTLGYQHPSNEVWIRGNNDNDVVSCAGQENANCMDSVHFYDYESSDHDGPYFGIQMGC